MAQAARRDRKPGRGRPGAAGDDAPACARRLHRYLRPSTGRRCFFEVQDVNVPEPGFSLTMPTAMDSVVWTAINVHRVRLEQAWQVGDRSSVLGAAKELVESVGRAVIVERGETLAENADMPRIVNTAHMQLQRQPGPGLESSEQGLTQLAQGAKSIALSVSELRNRMGSGHGRPFLPVVEAEVVEVAVDGCLLWCRWALRRLGHLIAGNPVALLRDLQQETFYRGTLGQRLVQANLPGLGEPEQQRLGAAVARRGQETFVVRWDGIDPAAESDDVLAWPPAYRRGLADGILTDETGAVHLNELGAKALLGVLRPLPDLPGEIARLRDLLGDLPPLGHRNPFGYQPAAEVEAALAWSAGNLPVDARDEWRWIVDWFRSG